MKYCTYCGKQLEEGEVCTCAGAQKTLPGLVKKLKKLAVPIAAAVVVLIVGIVLISRIGSGIDLNDYLVIEGVSGLNGHGVIAYDLDETGLRNAILGKKADDSSEDWELVILESLEKDLEVENTLDCITVTATPETDLSNGDVVTVRAIFKNDKGYKLKHHFKDAEQTFTVSGLAEGKTYDPFAEENVSVTFSGFSGSAVAALEVVSTEEVARCLSYELSQTEGLSNGDTVTATVSFDAQELEALGYVAPKTTEHAYTVSGLGEQLETADTITEDVIQKLCEQALERNKENEAKAGGPITDPSKVVGVYFLSPSKPGRAYQNSFEGVDITNAVAVVTHYTYELEGYGGLFYDRIHAWVFPNWYTDADGQLSYNEDGVVCYSAGNTKPEDIAEWFDLLFWSYFNVSEITVQ